jgi:hypothetical protein
LVGLQALAGAWCMPARAGTGSSRVDYIDIQEAPQNYCGTRPANTGQWQIGGGGCLALVAAGPSGGESSRWNEQMVAIGYNRGPNGVAEWGGGDDVSLGPVEATWSISEVANEAHSGEWCLTDSPDGLYPNSSVTSATIDRTFDLNGFGTVTLRFFHHWHMRHNAPNDDCDLDIRVNGGAWSTIATYEYQCGFHGSFVDQAVDLTAYVGDTVELRFTLASSSSARSDGWYIDDVLLEADGEVLFADDFETGTDGWILGGTWGLTGDVTQLIKPDRDEVALTFPISRDRLGNLLATVNGDGLVESIPVALPTPVAAGVGYVWVVAEHGGLSDGVMIYQGAMLFVPE